MKRIFDNIIALFVVVIVLFLVIPLPVQLLDFLLIINIGLSIMILMITMNITEALEFSIFPSIGVERLYHPTNFEQRRQRRFGYFEFRSADYRRQPGDWFYHLYHHRVGAVYRYHQRRRARG